MPDAWEQWIGQLIDGRFLLLQYLGGTNDSAVFLTERRERGQVHKAAIKLLPVPSDGGNRQFAQWRRAVKLSHPHLLRLFAMGRGKLGGEPLLYVVMEYADENIASLLPHRALAPAEAQIMLESTVDALAYLHSHGVVHGRIKPSNILADGNQVKLSSDRILLVGEAFENLGGSRPYDAPEYGERNGTAPHPASPAGDVWSLALTLGEALTQDGLAEKASAQDFGEALEGPDAPLSAPLREPFLDIVRHGLRWQPDDRWTLAQISSRMRGGAVAPQLELSARVPEAPECLADCAAPKQLAPVQIQTYAAKWGRHAIPAATGLAFILVIGAGAKLFRRAPQMPTVASAPVAAPATAAKWPQPEMIPTKSPKTSTPVKQREAESPKPSSASAQMETARETAPPARLATMPAVSVVPASVVQQAPPSVLPQARASIHGTVRVDVRVDVDPTGAVEGASLAARGPSRYFAQVALDNARSWRFTSAKGAGRNVLSRWTLHYQFTRFGTNVVPTQEVP